MKSSSQAFLFLLRINENILLIEDDILIGGTNTMARNITSIIYDKIYPIVAKALEKNI